MVEVVGQGTTSYVLDYGRQNRILSQTSQTQTTHYLYGHVCLAEFDQDEQTWRHYLPDATGQVRQIADEAGQVLYSWLFGPDGLVLAGPEGPVSHLVCGGVYDWSTGLIYQNGKYFDPRLGIWLALMPLAIVYGWRGRRKGWGHSLYGLVLVVGLSGILIGCNEPTPPSPPPTPTCTPTPPPPPPLCEVEKVEFKEGPIYEDENHPSKRGPGTQGFFKDMEITFLLKPNVQSRRDCVVGSWVKGDGWITKQDSKRTPIWSRSLSDWHYDFPIPDTSVFYHPDRIVFTDLPGIPFLDSGDLVEMQLEFITVVYDKFHLDNFISQNNQYYYDPTNRQGRIFEIPGPLNPDASIWAEPYPIYKYDSAQNSIVYEYKRSDPENYVHAWEFIGSHQVP